MRYQFLDHIAIADSAFEVEAENLAEIFEGAGLATMETMANLKTVQPKIKKEIKMSNEDVSELLFDFLNELIFIKDTEKMLFSKFKVDLEKKTPACPAGRPVRPCLVGRQACQNYYLKASLFGEKIDPKKHELFCDVKAVTLYKFKIWQEGNLWKARVVLDI